MTLAAEQRTIASATVPTVLGTLRRGVQLSPELRQGLWVTLVLAAVATGGRVVVPFAVQQTIDRGLMAAGGPDTTAVTGLLVGAAVLVLLTAACAYVVNLRVP